MYTFVFPKTVSALGRRTVFSYLSNPASQTLLCPVTGGAGKIGKCLFNEEVNEWMNGLLEQIRAFPHFEISVAMGHRLENIDQHLGLAHLE